VLEADAKPPLPTVYLAGPEVFLPDACLIGERKRRICSEHGLEGVFPLVDLGDGAGRSKINQARHIFDRCIELMDDSDVIIANMTPFRGVSMDVGTAFEMGYIFSQDKPIFAYTNEPGSYNDRMSHRSTLRPGERVEDFTLMDNVMCAIPEELSGPGIVRGGPVPLIVRLTDLAAFTSCVQRVAEYFVRDRPHSDLGQQF
jgi:nucleoside 2-deoxyribosyltransferase